MADATTNHRKTALVTSHRECPRLTANDATAWVERHPEPANVICTPATPRGPFAGFVGEDPTASQQDEVRRLSFLVEA